MANDWDQSVDFNFHLIEGAGDLMIPSRITSIGPGAFNRPSVLTEFGPLLRHVESMVMGNKHLKTLDLRGGLTISYLLSLLIDMDFFLFDIYLSIQNIKPQNTPATDLLCNRIPLHPTLTRLNLSGTTILGWWSVDIVRQSHQWFWVWSTRKGLSI